MNETSCDVHSKMRRGFNKHFYLKEQEDGSNFKKNDNIIVFLEVF